MNVSWLDCITIAKRWRHNDDTRVHVDRWAMLSNDPRVWQFRQGYIAKSSIRKTI